LNLKRKERHDVSDIRENNKDTPNLKYVWNSYRYKSSHKIDIYFNPNYLSIEESNVFDLTKLWERGYDDCSTMSGDVPGVKTRITE
jgi:hypothetical protein